MSKFKHGELYEMQHSPSQAVPLLLVNIVTDFSLASLDPEKDDDTSWPMSQMARPTAERTYV